MPDAFVAPTMLADRAGALPPAFDCSWTDDGPAGARVRVAGELDVATTPRMQRTLREAQAHSRLVVLDLRDLAFIDSCGVHAIVDASAGARRADGRLVVTRGAPGIDRVFRLTNSFAALEAWQVDGHYASEQTAA